LLHTTAGDRGRLRDPSGRLLLGAWSGSRPRPLLRDIRQAAQSSRPPGELGDEVVDAWDVALRRWLGRFAGISVSDLVLRPAAMAATPTHFDINFDLGAAEPRVRRAGLDLDPGWVRWFGRVVTFHYLPVYTFREALDVIPSEVEGSARGPAAGVQILRHAEEAAVRMAETGDYHPGGFS
jgi:hypothetical protein